MATGNSTSILATARLKLLERIDMVEVPYKGDAPATLACETYFVAI